MDWLKYGTRRLRRLRALAPARIERFETPKLVVGGTFRCRHIRDGKVIDEFDQHNLIVNEGLDHILGVEFTGVPQITNWYLGLFGNNYTPVASDQASSFPNNAGEVTAYSGGQRVGYQGVEGQQQVQNTAAPGVFTFNGQARVNVYGAFLSSASGIGSTAGKLFCAAAFSTVKPMDPGDQLAVTYAVAAQSA